MDEDRDKLALARQIEREISDYLGRPVTISKDHSFSEPKLKRRISLFENHIYPTGKFDSQGNYKHWFDIQTPRIESEVKNVDFDTKNIEAYSPLLIDEVPSLIVNLKNREWLRDNGQAEELNSAIEEGAGWGNVVWKKTKDGYERVDLLNFYVINQTARTLEETPVIERHQRTQAQVRALAGGKFRKVEEVLKNCGQNLYKAEVDATQQDTTTPVYTLYERNGEICVADLKEFRGETPSEGDRDKYVYGKIIAAGTEGTSQGISIKYIMFADDLPGQSNAKLYKEYHRGRYKGRWWREGLYELLFDVQVRANEIGNQISQGLQYASKTFYRAKDKLIVQNIITDLKNGDVIRSEDLQQVETRMEGFDQLMNDWNRIMELADEIANSHEIVQGVTPASGTPLGTTELLNQNAGKLHDFLREKIAIPIREIFEEWNIPRLVKELKVEDVLRLTGQHEMMERLRELLVENWYLENLIAIGPHTPEVAEALKAEKMRELSREPTIFLKEFKSMFDNYKARVSVVITGENVDRNSKLRAWGYFISLETDPVRRTFMNEKAMRVAGLDVGELPRTEPGQQPQASQQQRGAPTAQPQEPALA